MFLETTVVGYLGRDASVKYFGEEPVINFSVSHSIQWKNDKGEKQERTVWLNCAYWTKNMKVAEFLKTGTMVLVQGTPSASIFQAKNGEKKASLDIRVNNIRLLKGAGEKQNGEAEPGNAFAGSMEIPAPVKADDDLPY